MDQPTPKPGIQQILGTIFLIFFAVTLPGTDWSLFGWLHALLPLTVFICLCHYGETVGGKFILAGSALAALTGVIVPSLSLPLFSLSMLPAGFVLARSGLRGENPALAGLKGAAALLGCWALLIIAIGVTTGTSPYDSFVHTLNTGINETLDHYRQSGSLEPDAMMALESTLYQMRVVLPIVIPAFVVSCALFIIWFTMVLGDRLAARFYNKSVWPRFRFWQLPDRLIWLAIGCAIPAIAPGIARHVAVNLLIVLSVIYCFQGLAICVFFLNKWNVPPLFRSFIYVMIVFQSFGTLVLLVAGVADVWLDLRKLHPLKQQSGKNERND